MKNMKALTYLPIPSLYICCTKSHVLIGKSVKKKGISPENKREYNVMK